MAINNYIKVEASNRNNGQLRQCVDQFIRALALLDEQVDKIGQMTAGGTDYAGFEAEYGLDAGDGDDVESLLSSTKGELDNSPFLQQMISRLS